MGKKIIILKNHLFLHVFMLLKKVLRSPLFETPVFLYVFDLYVYTLGS